MTTATAYTFSAAKPQRIIPRPHREPELPKGGYPADTLAEACCGTAQLPTHTKLRGTAQRSTADRSPDGDPQNTRAVGALRVGPVPVILANLVDTAPAIVVNADAAGVNNTALHLDERVRHPCVAAAAAMSSTLAAMIPAKGRAGPVAVSTLGVREIRHSDTALLAAPASATLSPAIPARLQIATYCRAKVGPPAGATRALRR